MPILTSAKKAMRRDIGRRAVNDRYRRIMREAVKAFRKLVLAKDGKGAAAYFPQLSQAIDKAAKRGVITNNTAARKKSRLSLMLKKLG